MVPTEFSKQVLGGDHRATTGTGRAYSFVGLNLSSYFIIRRAIALGSARLEPDACGRPVSKWTRSEIAEEAVKRKIVPTISESHVSRILRSV